MLSRRTQMGLVLLAAVVMRLLVHQTFYPWWCGDSRGYTGPAAAIYEHRLYDWDGGRTPSYPLFVLGCELLAGAHVDRDISPMAGNVVTCMQTLLGVAAVVMIFLTMQSLRIRDSISFALALLYALLEPIAEFEMFILCEALCLFLLVLAAYLMARVLRNLERQLPAFWLSLGAGVVSGFAVLTRPNVPFAWALFTGLVPVIIYWWKRRRRAPLSLLAVGKTSGWCGLGGAVVIGAWLLFNWHNTGYLQLTPMADMTRTFAAYNLFDKVHPEDRVLGDIMVKYYRATNQNGNVAKDYAWQAFPEILDHYWELPFSPKRGPFPTVYTVKYMGHVANYLLWENPGTWLQNAWEDLLRTWDFSIPQGDPDYVGDPRSLYGTSVVANQFGWRVCFFLSIVEAGVMFGLYLATFACVAVSGYQLFQARDVAEMFSSLYCLVLALGAILTIVSTCVLAAYYPRFSIPVVPFMVVCTAWVIEFVARTMGQSEPGN
jgi:hypothetical protein